jgi:hypothetical protein
MSESASRTRRGVALLAVVLGALAVPLGLRAVNRAVRPPGAAPSYVPSIESPRVRAPFDSAAVAALREAANDCILIGDSMAGTRIDPVHLSRLMGGHGAAALFHPGSGPAYWYLAFKNFVVNPGLRPRAVVFFFRDENLTDTLFRVYPGSLDRVARDREPVLDELFAKRASGPYYRVHGAIRSLYRFDQTRAWVEPLIVRAPLAWAAGRRARKTLLESMNNEVFALEALRHQLESCREAAALDGMVLSDEDGLALAAVGDPDVTVPVRAAGVEHRRAVRWRGGARVDRGAPRRRGVGDTAGDVVPSAHRGEAIPDVVSAAEGGAGTAEGGARRGGHALGSCHAMTCAPRLTAAPVASRAYTVTPV